MATTTSKKVKTQDAPLTSQPYVPSYANGGIQYTGQGATPAQTNNPYTTTRVTGISQKNSKGQDVPVPLNQPAQFGANVQYGAGGQMTGVNFPDGRNFQNLQHDQVQSLLNDWNNTPENKIKADLAQQQLVKDVTAQNTPKVPPNVTAEQLAQVGQTNPNYQPDTNALETTQSILQNIDRRKQENPLTADRITAGNLISPLLSPNKLTGPLTKLGGGVGEAIVSLAGQNKDARDYLKDYSNDNSYDHIVGDITNAQNNLHLALKEANQIGSSQQAITDYNNAIDRLRYANSQLKMIEQGDQRAYVDDIKTKRIALENYLNHNVAGQGGFNQLMASALMKPDPTWVDNTVNQIMNGGGVQNG